MAVESLAVHQGGCQSLLLRAARRSCSARWPPDGRVTQPSRRRSGPAAHLVNFTRWYYKHDGVFPPVRSFRTGLQPCSKRTRTNVGEGVWASRHADIRRRRALGLCRAQSGASNSVEQIVETWFEVEPLKHGGYNVTWVWEYNTDITGFNVRFAQDPTLNLPAQVQDLAVYMLALLSLWACPCCLSRCTTSMSGACRRLSGIESDHAADDTTTCWTGHRRTVWFAGGRG
eukprot:scaffold304_cov409-Prasinococcus_capsulatus_cf.AAC.1